MNCLLFATLSIKLLSIFFVIHIILRVYWICLILLKKLYPNEINFNNLQLLGPYLSLASKFNLQRKIIAVDRLSSFIFIWAITLAAILTGISIVFGIIILPSVLRHKGLLNPFLSGIIAVILHGSAIVYMIDTIFHGIIRKSYTFAKGYYPFFIFWNSLSLGIIWRPILQIIYSNLLNKRKTTLLLSLVSAFSVLLTADSNDIESLFNINGETNEKYVMDESRYLDNYISNRNKLDGSYIQSGVITDSYLKVINYDILSSKNRDSLNTNKLKYSIFIEVRIDDSLYEHLEWAGVNNLQKQFGLQTVINIEHLKKQLHLLEVNNELLDNKIIIPFWKE
ncbi:MAG: hypothetical protein KDC57_17075 [Saprospiraceae bacterium]|nr:hypothetical protein [Saprospiraceae bacterium]